MNWGIFICRRVLSAAEERFKGVVGLKPELSGQIADTCPRLGYAQLEKESAFRTINMALSFNPALKKEIADYCFEKGTAFLEGIIQNADSNTSVTHRTHRSNSLQGDSVLYIKGIAIGA